MGFGDVHAPSYIDSARLALSIRPVPIFWISGGFSYWGLAMPNDEPIATYPGPSRRADGSVGGDATDGRRIAAITVTEHGDLEICIIDVATAAVTMITDSEADAFVRVASMAVVSMSTASIVCAPCIAAPMARMPEPQP